MGLEKNKPLSIAEKRNVLLIFIHLLVFIFLFFRILCWKMKYFISQISKCVLVVGS